MKTQPMANAVRATLTVSETNALIELAKAGVTQLGPLAPAGADTMIRALASAARMVAANRAATRARRATVPSAAKPHRNLNIGQFTISAHLGDYIDASPDPDARCWISATDERSADQRELRRDVWLVHVLNPDRYDQGRYFLRSDCTETSDERELRDVAERLVETVTAEGLFA